MTDDTMHDELETLRGIARRIGDGWRPNRRERVWRSSPVHAEPMTPAEVAAIWPEMGESGGGGEARATGAP